MKTAIFLTGIIFVSVLILFLTSCKTKSNARQNNVRADNSSDSTSTLNQNDNPYEGLRKLAFDRTPEQLNITVANSEIYGVIMDWDFGNYIVTLVTYKTGDASLYLSSGGAVIGGGPNKSVNLASKKFVSLANKYLNKTIKIDSITSPEKNCIRFYFLTVDGIFSAKENMTYIENKSSDWLELFDEANNVITEFRKSTENRL